MPRFLGGVALGLVLGIAVSVFVFANWLGLFSPAPPLPAPQPQFGNFHGEVHTKWLDDGRDMKLLEDFGYLDPADTLWLAPKDSVVNGASIPKAFWSLIDGPFEGRFRNASVVHDVACERMDRPCAQVHRMFYFACRAGGVDENLAKTIYWAVANKGPQWKLVYETRIDDDMKTVSVAKPVDMVETQEVSDEEVKAALRYFQTHDPSLEEIQALDMIPAQ